MRVACGDVYVGSWRALIEVLIEAGRDPRRRRPARAGRAGRPAGRVLPPAGQENKKRISFYRTRTTKRRSHHPTARVAPLIADKIALPIRGQAVR